MQNPDDPNDYQWDDEPPRDDRDVPWYYSPLAPVILSWVIVYAIYRAVLVVWHSL